MSRECKHNQRARYTHGFFCENCRQFFPKDSPTYRRSELIFSIYCVLSNLNADAVRAGSSNPEALALRARIDPSGRDPNYENLIAEAEALFVKYGVTSDSANLVLKSEPDPILDAEVLA